MILGCPLCMAAINGQCNACEVQQQLKFALTKILATVKIALCIRDCMTLSTFRTSVRRHYNCTSKLQ